MGGSSRGAVSTEAGGSYGTASPAAGACPRSTRRQLVALPLTKERPRKLLTASASRMEPANTPTNQRRAMEWQRHAFTVVKTVPELNFASRFYSKMLKRLRIYPATLDANGRVVEITNG